MRPGTVVTIRVNPKDCMAVVDIIKASGMSIEGMSFPSMVSLALSSLIDGAKKINLIPERTGFEYNELMGPYLGTVRTKRKLQITEQIHKAGSEFTAPKLEIVPPVFRAAEILHSIEPMQVTTEQRSQRTRLAELNAKKDMVESGVPELIWSQQDEQEYQELYKAVYPDG